jgi:teichoic acid transport system permease protein
MSSRKTHKSTQIITEHTGFSHQIWHLAWLDLHKSYRGALLGWAWVIVQPLIMLGFYWFIIAIGFRSDSVPGATYEYLPWLIVGLCAWFFVSDMINVGVGAFRKYKFLITKTKFPVATIPTIVTISNFVVHVILLSICLAYLYFEGYFALQWLQLPIYTILALALMWCWTLFAAPIGAISKDFMQLVKSIMRVLVWVSGILWSIGSVHIHWLREIMQLNPIYFIAEGYRKSLIYHQWFFEDWREFGIFMFELIVLAALAVITYKRTRKDLVDTL